MIYDVAIIGGGPVGSTAATLLARAGLKVIVFEREKFPRDHVGESLLPFCHGLFKDLGLLDEMKRRFSRKPGVQFTSIDNTTQSIWCFGHIIQDESFLSYHVLRAEFDEMLLNFAQSKGADTRQEHLVTKTEKDENNLHQIHYRNKQNTGTVKAKFLIDASGQDCFLPNKNKTKVQYEGMSRAAFACHWKGVKYDEALNEGLIQIVYLGGEKKGWIWMIPLESDRLSVGVALNADYVKKRRNELAEKKVKNWQEELYMCELSQAAKAQEILHEARKVQPVITVSDFSYYSSEQYGKDFAILGDSVAFLDPIFSSGIYMGMKSAYVLCEKLIENFSNGTDLNLGFDKVYGEINGAYSLVEKFVRLFYNPDKLDMAALGTHSKMAHLQHEQAFALVHYLLAGDFFSQHAKYSEFLELLEKPEMFSRYKNLVFGQHSTKYSCGHKPEEIYPDLLAKFPA